MNHKYEQRTICPNGEIRTRTIDANELVDLLLQMHFLKQSGEQLMQRPAPLTCRTAS